MRLADPWMLTLLILLPIAAWGRRRWAGERAFIYSSVNLVKGITELTRSTSSRVLSSLRWLALVLAIIALARPQLTEGRTSITASGIDIVVALDLSGSMAAEDFELDNERVNRVEVAKKVLEGFIAKRPSDRIGLVAFAGQAYVATPLTLDHEFLLENLDRLDIGVIEDGTAIGSALSAGLNRLRKLESLSRIVILMTDGQNTTGEIPPLTAAEAARALKVKVYTIGVGTQGMAPMPATDAFGRKGYRQVPVNIDEETLKEIAAKTGGKYYRALDTDSFREIYEEIDRFEKTEIQVNRFQRYEELYMWFVLPSLSLLLIEILLNHTIWRRLP